MNTYKTIQILTLALFCHSIIIGMDLDEKLKFSAYDDTSQDEPISIKTNIAAHSNTITNMLEDNMFDDPTHRIIPLDKLNHTTLTLVKIYLKLIHKMKQPTESGITKNKTRRKLCALVRSLSHPMLKSIIHASNFLEIKKLLQYGCNEWKKRCFSKKNLKKLYRGPSSFNKEKLLLPPEIDILTTSRITTQLAQHLYKSHIKNTHPLHNKTIHTSTAQFHSVTFNPDGSCIAAGANDNLIYLFDAQTLLLLEILPGHIKSIGHIIFGLPHTKLLASSGDDAVRLWHLDTNTCDLLEGHTKPTNFVAFNASSTLLASTSDDTTTRIWDITTKNCLYIINGNTQRTWKVVFNTDNLVTAASFDNTVKQWKLLENKTTKLRKEFQHSYGELCFNKKHTLFATDTQNCTIRIVNIKNNTLKKELAGHRSIIRTLAFNHDDTLLASGSQNNTIRIWDVETGDCLKTLNNHTGSVYEVQFSPDGCQLISASLDRTLHMWTLLGQEKKQILSKLQKNTLLKHVQLLWLALTKHKSALLDLKNHKYLKELFYQFSTTEQKFFKKHLNIIG